MENENRKREEQYRQIHLAELEKASMLCVKSSESIFNVSKNIKHFLEKIESDIKIKVPKNISNEKLNSNKMIIEKLYKSKTKIEDIIYELSFSDRCLEKIKKSIDDKKKKIDELKLFAEKFYNVKFEQELWTNTSRHTAGFFTRQGAKIDDCLKRRKINKLVYKNDLLFPEDILSEKIDPESEEGKKAIQKHDEKRRKELIKNIGLCIISGSVSLILKSTLIDSLIPILGPILVLHLLKKFKEKFNKQIRYKKMGYLQAEDGVGLLIDDISKIYICFKDYIKKFKEDYLTKEKILNTLEHVWIEIKDEIDSSLKELFSTLIQLIKELDDFKINKDEILANIKKFPKKFSYRANMLFDEIRNNDKVVMFYTPKELKSTRKILYKLTGEKDNFLERVKKRLKLEWKFFDESAKRHGIDGRKKIIELITLKSMEFIIPFSLEELGKWPIGILISHIPPFVKGDFLKNIVSNGIFKILMNSNDFDIKVESVHCVIDLNMFGRIKKEFASVIASIYPNAIKKRMKEIIIFFPKIFGEAALGDNMKWFDKTYYYDMKKFENNKNIHAVINRSVNFITEVFKTINQNYGGRYLK